MASNPYVNKVEANGTVLIDLTGDDATASDVEQGKWFHLASGERVQGTSEGGGGSTIQPLSVTQNGTYTPPSGVDGYAPVTVNVPSGGSQSDNDLLFHFDSGYENSGKTQVAFINATGLTISDEQSKFGGKSLKTGTTQIYNNVALPFDFEFDSDDFTLDFWCYPTNLPSGSSSFVVPLSFSYRSLAIYMNLVGVQFGVAKTNGSWFDYSTTAVTITNNEWHHVALVRDGYKIYGFLDGVKVKTVDFGSDAYAPVSYMTLGSNTYGRGDRRFNGYIDELRLKLGEAVWTEDFTPPTQPYE